MIKKTVAQIREENIYKLAKRSKNFETDPAVFNKARKAFNSFYRLAAFSMRLFEINNDYNLYEYYTKRGELEKLEAREETWQKRTRKYFEEFGAEVVFSGLYPIIIEKRPENKGAYNRLFLEAWYN